VTRTSPSSDTHHLQRGSAAPGAASMTVTGTLTDGTGSVSGRIDLVDTVDSGVGWGAVGTFTGTVTNAAGSVTTGTQGLELPLDRNSAGVRQPAPGPICLVLLGWDVRVTVMQADLDAGAQSGAGVR